MNILFDLGNSYCKYAIEKHGNITKHASIKFPAVNKISIFDSLLDELLCEFESLPQMIICSVHGEGFNQQLLQLCNDHQIDKVYFLNPARDSFTINLAYSDPSQLGADRLAVMLACAEKYTGRTCIVDCGTAITIDELQADKQQHRGGLIFPGLQSMQKTLSSTTEIKHPTFGEGFNLFAKTTQDGIYAGCLSAVVGGIEYIVNSMQETYDRFDQLVITGGNAEHLMSMLNIDFKHEPTLVLDGLLVVAKKLSERN